MPEGMLETRGRPLHLWTQSRKDSFPHEASIENLLGAGCAGLGTEDTGMEITRNWQQALSVGGKQTRGQSRATCLREGCNCSKNEQPLHKSARGQPSSWSTWGPCYLYCALPLLHPRLTKRFASVVLICKSAFLTLCQGIYLCPLPH